MVVVISCSVLSVIIAYFSSYKGRTNNQLLKLSFFPITLVQMIRFDYGTDYMSYYNDHLTLYNRSFAEFVYLKSIGHGSFKDMGWAVLCHFFPGKVGFFILVALLSLIQNIIYYKLIREYVEPKHRWRGLAIYLFSTSIYVVSFSAVRQAFTVAIGIYAIILSCNERLKLAVPLVLLASTIHASLVLMLPFLFLSRMKIKDGKIIANIIIVSTAILFFSTALVNKFYTAIMQRLPALARRYGNYINTMGITDSSVGFGFALNLVMYIVILFFIYRRFDAFSQEYKIFMILTCVSLIVLPFQLSISGIISRIMYYFSVFEIAVVPTVYSKIKDKYIRLGVSFIYIFMMLYAYFFFFFVTEWSANAYRDFHTIFSAID